VIFLVSKFAFKRNLYRYKQERKHLAGGGAAYTKEQRDKALSEINAKMAPPATAASARKQARRSGGGGRGGHAASA
jgi:hypothetical protein